MPKLKTFFIALFVIFIATAGSSCKLNKIKKQTDYKIKLAEAVKYYDAEKYGKALMLLDDILLETRGLPEGEEVLRKLAYSNYHVKDYILAGYYFRKYTEYYPKGKYAEDAGYMSAYCYYLDAPKTSLDQSATNTALGAFETFISKYPKSEKITECNKLVDELRFKLEKKSYDNAKLYYDLGYYNAAIVSLKNSLQSYPDSKYKELSLYYILRSSYAYAENSIISKRKERYENTIAEYKIFNGKFPESEYADEALKISKNATKKIEKLTEEYGNTAAK